MDGPHPKVNRAASTIAVSNLSFAYVRSPVLSEVSFTLDHGAVGLLGPNGSGKTTLLRALLGHLKLPPLAVTVMGRDMAKEPRAARRRLGWMPELGGIIPGMSGVSMVAYLGELSGMPGRDAMQRAHEVLDYVGLAEERYRNCEDYSQGMRQRLKLAQALVHDPAWVLLDWGSSFRPTCCPMSKPFAMRFWSCGPVACWRIARSDGRPRRRSRSSKLRASATSRPFSNAFRTRVCRSTRGGA
jgi:ABC-type molybdenum transport system ATPase subunit/photorepair protein PhrA